MQWHIDYLSVKTHALGAMIVPGPRQRECELTDELASLYERAIPEFGSSDCRCGGHLFYVPAL
jgi:sugar fermentation stimulation protein A